MNEYFWILAFTFFSTGSISILALATDRGYLDPLKRSFSWFSATVSLWAGGVCLMFYCDSLACATQWSKIYTIPVCFLPVSYMHYVHNLTGKINRWILGSLYVVAFLLTLLIFQGSVVAPATEKYGYKFMIQAGPLYFLIVSLFITLVVYSLGVLLASYRASAGLKKQQILYVLVGTGVGYIGGLPNLWVPYNTWIYPLNPYASLSIVFFVAVIAYAMLRYRLMDIRFLIHESKQYYFSSGIVSLVFGILIGIFSRDFKLGAIVFIVTMFSPYIQKKIKNWIGLIRSRRDLVDPESISGINSIADRIQEAGNTISDLGDTVAKLVFDEFSNARCGLFFFDHEAGNFYLQSKIGIDRNFIPRFEVTDPLIVYLEKNQEVLVLSEARQFLSKDEYESVTKVLQELEFEVCAPLIIRKSLSGFIVLGSKLDEKPYFINEITRIQGIASETSHSLRYALGRLGDISKTRKWAHTLYQKLKSLKSGFNYFKSSDPEFAENPDKVEVHFQINKVINQLNSFFKYLVHTSRIESEAQKNTYEKKPVDIEKIIKESLSEYRHISKPKNINIKLAIQTNGVILFGHSVDLKSVFEAIISNAFRYVPDQGTIDITSRINGDSFLISIYNNGPPIPEKHHEDIFKENFQIIDGSEGAGGLGLANSKKIIDLHDGKIKVKNGENNTGVSFIIKLPIIAVESGGK